MICYKRYFILLILLWGNLLACKKKQAPQTNKPDHLTFIELFDTVNNPFYQKIDIHAEIDPQSAQYINRLLEANQAQGFFIAQKKWTVPVYFSGPETPLQDVKLTVSWAQYKYIKQVPIPDYAAPDPEGDAEMTIVDTVNGCMYDFWQARNTHSGWKASWANALPLGSDGIFPVGMSCRGAGFALLNGVIWPHEIINGAINHAIEFTYPYCKSGGPVLPATETDGTGHGTYDLPEGARLQLNPALNLDSLNLNPYEKVIAKALQEYGMILGDDGGGIEIEVIHPMSAKINPWQGILPDSDYVYLRHIPLDEFRLLKLGQQYTQDTKVVLNACNIFE